MAQTPDRFAVDLEGTVLLGHYKVGEQLGHGGMATVYRAADTDLGRDAVIKVPHARFLGEDGFRERFEREMQGLMDLEHPHVVSILARGEHDGIPFFVLQYLRGGSLEDTLRKSPGHRVKPTEVVPWLATIADTLDFIHQRRIVHRDIKPANILFDEHGHVFISDFGIVKALDQSDSTTLTGTNAMIGTPGYMAPEQAGSRKVTGAADQYALAATAYEALGGRSPFHEGTPIEIAIKKSSAPPPDIRSRVPTLPDPAADAIMKALERDPKKRHATCKAFVMAFDLGLAGESSLDDTFVGDMPDDAPSYTMSHSGESGFSQFRDKVVTGFGSTSKAATTQFKVGVSWLKQRPKVLAGLGAAALLLLLGLLVFSGDDTDVAANKLAGLQAQVDTWAGGQAAAVEEAKDALDTASVQIDADAGEAALETLADAEALLARANALRQRALADVALNALIDSDELDAGEAVAHRAEGEAALAAGHFDEASTAFSDVYDTFEAAVTARGQAPTDPGSAALRQDAEALFDLSPDVVVELKKVNEQLEAAPAEFESSEADDREALYWRVSALVRKRVLLSEYESLLTDGKQVTEDKIAALEMLDASPDAQASLRTYVSRDLREAAQEVTGTVDRGLSGFPVTIFELDREAILETDLDPVLAASLELSRVVFERRADNTYLLKGETAAGSVLLESGTWSVAGSMLTPVTIVTRDHVRGSGEPWRDALVEVQDDTREFRFKGIDGEAPAASVALDRLGGLLRVQAEHLRRQLGFIETRSGELDEQIRVAGAESVLASAEATDRVSQLTQVMLARKRAESLESVRSAVDAEVLAGDRLATLKETFDPIQGLIDAADWSAASERLQRVESSVATIYADADRVLGRAPDAVAQGPAEMLERYVLDAASVAGPKNVRLALKVGEVTITLLSEGVYVMEARYAGDRALVEAGQFAYEQDAGYRLTAELEADTQGARAVAPLAWASRFVFDDQRGFRVVPSAGPGASPLFARIDANVDEHHLPSGKIQFLAPSASAVLGSERVTVRVLVEDWDDDMRVHVQGVAMHRVEVEDGDATLEAELTLAEGPQEIEAVLSGPSIETKPIKMTVQIDTTVPQISLDPLDQRDGVVARPQVTVKGRVTDLNADRVKVTVGDKSFGSSRLENPVTKGGVVSRRFEVEVTIPRSEETTAVTVSAFDAAGNEARVRVSPDTGGLRADEPKYHQKRVVEAAGEKDWRTVDDHYAIVRQLGYGIHKHIHDEWLKWKAAPKIEIVEGKEVIPEGTVVTFAVRVTSNRRTDKLVIREGATQLRKKGSRAKGGSWYEGAVATELGAHQFTIEVEDGNEKRGEAVHEVIVLSRAEYQALMQSQDKVAYARRTNDPNVMNAANRLRTPRVSSNTAAKIGAAVVGAGIAKRILGW